MTLLTEWLLSGWIGVIAVAVLWIETIVLCLLSTAPAARFKALLANALSGTCLLTAVNIALVQGSLAWIAALLAGSLVAHAVDIVMRIGAPPRD